ncbi:MAG: hypothetical protein HY558_00305 [Euryarchaeota archaeon]|nr:hypothetical protein [Euryarchaeota archaeon]
MTGLKSPLPKYYLNGAREILDKKGLLKEIEGQFQGYDFGRFNPVNVPLVIRSLLRGKGWRQDFFTDWAFKDRVRLDILLRDSCGSTTDRYFFDAEVLYRKKRIDALIQLVETDHHPKFWVVKRDMAHFRGVLTVPICLIGIPCVDVDRQIELQRAGAYREGVDFIPQIVGEVEGE